LEKRSQEIVNSQVISISDGVQVGTVKDFLISPRQKAVDFLLLNEGEGELRGIPFRLADGVGEYAITVQDKGAIVDMSRIGVLQEIIDQGIKIIGTKMISNKGRYLGEAVEFTVDTLSGELTQVIYREEDGGEKSVEAHSVMTLGLEVIVVDDSAVSAQTVQLGRSSESEGAGENFNKGDERSFSVEEEKVQDAEPEVDPVKYENTAGISQHEGVQETSQEENQEGDLDPTGIFVKRQKDNLIGKTLIKDFKTDDGEVLAHENEVVTEELFNRVYQIGTQKLVELATSVRE